MIASEYGGGIGTWLECFYGDQFETDTAYYAILRRKQMKALNDIPEDEWPDPGSLQGYEPRFPSDVNYYYPDDLFVPLGNWLRDHSIESRKNAAHNKNQQKGRAITDQLLG